MVENVFSDPTTVSDTDKHSSQCNELAHSTCLHCCSSISALFSSIYCGGEKFWPHALSALLGVIPEKIVAMNDLVWGFESVLWLSRCGWGQHFSNSSDLAGWAQLENIPCFQIWYTVPLSYFRDHQENPSQMFLWAAVKLGKTIQVDKANLPISPDSVFPKTRHWNLKSRGGSGEVPREHTLLSSNFRN